MYAKLFSSLYQGTLRGRSDEILVFTNLLAHCDKEGYVDKHFRAIAEETGISQDRVMEAIGILERPDLESRSPEAEGRRIVRIDDHRAWGWQVVNFLKYRGIRDEEARRETWRKSTAKRRAGQHLSTHVNTGQPPSTHTDTDTEADTELPTTKKKSAGKPLTLSRKTGTVDELKAYAESIGLPESDGEAMHDHWTANGWKNGANPVKDWQAGIRKWKSQGWLPSQKAPNGGKQKPQRGYNENLELP